MKYLTMHVLKPVNWWSGLIAVLLLSGHSLLGQRTLSLPEIELERVDVEAHVRVLAADAMMGRMTGTAGNDQAASYIAAQLAAFGVDTIAGADGYFQYLHFRSVRPAEGGSLQMGDQVYEVGEDLMLLEGAAVDRSAEVVFAGHGWVDTRSGYNDYEGLDVEGKLVVVLPGTPEESDPGSVFRIAVGGKKLREASDRGAVGLIELARFRMNWPVVRQAISRLLRMRVVEGGPLPTEFQYGWLGEGETDVLEMLRSGEVVEAALQSTGVTGRDMRSQNVAGLIEGIDPDLRQEVVVVSAHYDHVGGGSLANGSGMTPSDSIFNGARDNALGVAALLATARALSERPPRRSVLFLALTAEEMGMIGSTYYVNHPLVPLEHTVFNINTDGAGYNDKSKISVIGIGRTNADDLLMEGSRPFGLDILENPMPEQNLYERSDNIAFARTGIPAVTISPGITAFDESITANYHRVSDEADTLDYGYVLRYCQTMAHMTRVIADASYPLDWQPDDPYARQK